MIPDYTGDIQSWARQVRAAFVRFADKLRWKTQDANASENGVMLWCEEEKAPVVARDGAFVPLLAWVDAPGSASDTGTTGQAAYDGSYIYICTATNTWVRAAIATW